MTKFGYVYIMTDKNKTTLYVGVTNDLCQGWSSVKKEALINKKNPDWKVLVTERGFVRDSSPAAQNLPKDALPSIYNRTEWNEESNNK